MPNAPKVSWILFSAFVGVGTILTLLERRNEPLCSTDFFLENILVIKFCDILSHANTDFSGFFGLLILMTGLITLLGTLIHRIYPNRFLTLAAMYSRTSFLS